MRTNLFIGAALITIIVVAIFLFNRYESTPHFYSSITSNQPAAVMVPFIDIKHGLKSSVAIRVNYLITSTSQLNQLWKLVGATSTPPVIDFKTNAIIAAFAGNESNSAISISNIEDTNKRTVFISMMKSDRVCAQRQPITSPYDVVVMPVTSLSLTHVDTAIATTSCF